MPTRREVYEVISGERTYQDSRWSPPSAHQHTVTEWLVYMQDYLSEAMHIVSRNGDPQASARALHNVRKITAMGVACMEQNGAPARETK